MKIELPKKFGTAIKLSAIGVFTIYAALTSKVEKVNSLETEYNDDIIHNVVPHETIEEINHNLDFMERKVVQTGMDGLTVEYNGVKIEVQKPQTEIIQVGEKFIDTFIGSITGYGPDCKGCSGIVSAGQNMKNGNIYYNDSKYGKLRIIAADRKYPFGTIFRISNSKVLSEPTLAIVLDRGSAIKGNKIDLLFESEKSVPNETTQKNITVDVVRLGW